MSFRSGFRFVSKALAGWLRILLAGIFSILIAREAQTQEPTPDQLAQYHLIQVVDPNTFVEKINEAAGQGYRLMAMSRASAQSLSAIIERVEKASDAVRFLKPGGVFALCADGLVQESGPISCSRTQIYRTHRARNVH
jgi:hypothetical protein